MRPFLAGAAASLALAGLLYAAFGAVGLVNYDTLYAVVWARDLVEGTTPDLEVALAPTPHPLLTVAALATTPFIGAPPPEYGDTAQGIVVAAAYVSLGALGVLTYALGAATFGRAAGIVAALIILTREPVLSYGVRAYNDLPYLCLLLGALLVETKRPRAGAPVLALLTLAGLLRPEAWLFAAAYWLYLARAREPNLIALALLAAAAPVLWALHDLLLTGDPLFSLTGTQANADELQRITGLDDVPFTMPRRIGEILREPVLLAAAGGGILSLLWLRERARLLAAAGLLMVAAFVVLAAAGLSILVRYLLPAATVLAIFAGAGLTGWTLLPEGDRRRRPWIALAVASVLLAVVLAPQQWRRLDRLQAALARQEVIVADLRDLVVRGERQPARVIGGSDGRSATQGWCEPLTVPNRRPVPYLALWLGGQPADVRVATDGGVPPRATYFLPASNDVAGDFILDARDRDRRIPPPPRSLRPAAANASWRAYTCR